MLWGEYLHLAAIEAVAHIRAFDLEQFYGEVFDTWDIEEQRKRTAAKNEIALFIERKWIHK